MHICVSFWLRSLGSSYAKTSPSICSFYYHIKQVKDLSLYLCIMEAQMWIASWQTPCNLDLELMQFQKTTIKKIIVQRENQEPKHPLKNWISPIISICNRKREA